MLALEIANIVLLYLLLYDAYIGSRSRAPLKFKDSPYRNSNFAIENHLSLVSGPPNFQ